MDAFQEVIADLKAYHGLLMEVTNDPRIDIDVRLEIIGKMRKISGPPAPV